MDNECFDYFARKELPFRVSSTANKLLIDTTDTMYFGNYHRIDTLYKCAWWYPSLKSPAVSGNSPHQRDQLWGVSNIYSQPYHHRGSIVLISYTYKDYCPYSYTDMPTPFLVFVFQTTSSLMKCDWIYLEFITAEQCSILTRHMYILYSYVNWFQHQCLFPTHPHIHRLSNVKKAWFISLSFCPWEEILWATIPFRSLSVRPTSSLPCINTERYMWVAIIDEPIKGTISNIYLDV
jgi:hypothetical protein